MRKQRATTLDGQISSNIIYWSYNKRQRRLTIWFSGGSRYRYSNITADLLQEWRAAKSLGIFFVQRVRNNKTDYPYVRVV